MFILYVAHDRKVQTRHDTGSILCMNLIPKLSEGIQIQVVEASLHMRNLPQWLVGTPTLVCESTGDIWRGHEALSQLQQLVILAAEERGRNANPKKKRTSAMQSSIAPSLQLRPDDETATKLLLHSKM